MFYVEYISGPLVGAVIGYFTNYIAVKMLFHPYNPVNIGKFKLPFTPGIIPKRQGELARAIGNAVGKKLFTGDDLKNEILTDENIRMMTEKICMIFSNSEKNVEAEVLSFMSSEQLNISKNRITEIITDKLISAALEINIGEIVAQCGAEVIREKKDSMGMLAFVLNDAMLLPILNTLGSKVNIFVENNGKEKLMPVVNEYIEKTLKKPLSDINHITGTDRFMELCTSCIRKIGENIFSRTADTIDIASVVENKVNAMNVSELEDLCMSVMKKELNSVVNLGALIGFVIGIINIFI